MKLKDIGERTLIELARKICKRGSRVKVGIGDDAAIVTIDDRCIVATTDMLVAQTHFPPKTTPEQMGRKAVAANLSDLAAMGVEPLGLLFSISMPRKLEVNFAKRLMRAIDRTAQKYRTHVVGGDLDESEEITIAGSAFGVARENEILTRSGAKPGDVLALTGRLGGASAGLKISLERLPSKGFLALLKAQFDPIARVREGVLLARSGFITSAIDISDGLAADLWQLARESGVRFVIDRAKIPEHSLVRSFALINRFDVDDFVLFGGEDFELLFTVQPKGWKKVQRVLERMGTEATSIGRVMKGREVFMEKDGKIQPLPDLGYEHFR